MKSIRPILTVAFSLLVLLSSSSFTIGVHYCSGRINGVAFLEKADGCGHAKMPPCHRKMMKDCCEDETMAHEAQGFKVDLFKVAFSTVAVDVIKTPALISEIIPESTESRIKFFNYDTPLRSSDRTIIHHVFLI